jgi:hypothetical protein
MRRLQDQRDEAAPALAGLKWAGADGSKTARTRGIRVRRWAMEMKTKP